MAMTQVHNGSDTILDAGHGFFHQMQEALARRKVYRSTRSELAALSDRELRDLGISRSGIKRLALEAAYNI